MRNYIVKWRINSEVILQQSFVENSSIRGSGWKQLFFSCSLNFRSTHTRVVSLSRFCPIVGWAEVLFGMWVIPIMLCVCVCLLKCQCGSVGNDVKLLNPDLNTRCCCIFWQFCVTWWETVRMHGSSQPLSLSLAPSPSPSLYVSCFFHIRQTSASSQGWCCSEEQVCCHGNQGSDSRLSLCGFTDDSGSLLTLSQAVIHPATIGKSLNLWDTFMQHL